MMDDEARDCRTIFTEMDLFRAHALVLPETEARELAHDLAEVARGPSSRPAWSQTSLILLSLLGPEYVTKVDWVRRNCGFVTFGLVWDVELEWIRKLLGPKDVPG